MRKLAIAVLCTGILLGSSPLVFAQGIDTMVRTQAQSLDTRALDQEVSRLVGQHPGMRIPSTTAIVSDLLHHKNPMNLPTLLNGLEGAVAGDLAVEGRVLGITITRSPRPPQTAIPTFPRAVPV